MGLNHSSRERERQDPYREHLLEGTYAQGILSSVASHPLPFFVQPPLQWQQGWEEWTFYLFRIIQIFSDIQFRYRR